jgi:uncharacterized protein (TIGR00730 family)
MADRLPRRLTGDSQLDQQLVELLDGRNADREDRDLLFDMLATVVRMAEEDVDRLDLKITSSALKEMRRAFRVFAPFRDVPKVTIFGSARTLPEDPLYVQTRDLAAALARAGWMVVTGAGPGIMAAGAEGAGRERSIGVNIRLPFEQEANPFIAADPKLVSMKYFFTRKLMLMKESAGFVVLPGGFGTLDETFELLTLLQTGKAAPAPLVLLDVPGGTYWEAWSRFIEQEVEGRGLVSEHDRNLCHITTDVDDAVGHVLGFFRNYHSIRYVGTRLVMRLRAAPTPGELDELNAAFADISLDGPIEPSGPLPAEVADGDHVELPRLVFRFDRMNHGRLRALIDALNRLPSAPPLALPDRGATSAAGSPPETVGPGQPGAVPQDPVVAELLARAGGADEQSAVEAAAELQAVMGDDRLNDAAVDALSSEVCRLVLETSSNPVRVALLKSLAGASPAHALDQTLELLLEHQAALDDEATTTLLRAIGGMLEAALERQDGRTAVANLLRAEDPRPVLDRLAASANRRLADRARHTRRQVDRVISVRGR